MERKRAQELSVEAAIIWDERNATRKGTEGCCEPSTNHKWSQNKPQRYEENPPSLPQTAQENLIQEGHVMGHTSTSDRRHLLLPITVGSQQAAAGLISQLVFFFSPSFTFSDLL